MITTKAAMKINPKKNKPKKGWNMRIPHRWRERIVRIKSNYE
jgi:hypothetical protein